MSSGGGETLRAVMTATCTFSQPAFYGVNIPTNYSSQPAVFTGFLQCHNDAWFLATSLFAFGNRSGSPQFLDNPTPISLFDPKNNRQFFLNPSNMIAGNINENLTSCFTMPEYILWEPGSLIGVNWAGLGAANNGDFNTFVLAGIEYKK
jgi:hypothetical protein